MCMDRNVNNISDKFFKVAAKFSEIDENSKCEIEDDNFVNTEMNIVKIIKEHEEIHVTGMAEILGVTKGAVSQVLGRLEKKGVVVKERDYKNMSRLVLKLTPKGERLYEIHEAFHAELNEIIRETLENSTEENRVFLKNFLDAVETRMLKIHIK